MSHRASAVCLFALLGTAAAGLLGHEFYMPLTAAAACGDVGLCGGLLALSFTRPGEPRWREAVGVMAFNGTLAVVALVLMLIARAGVIQDAIRQDGAAARSALQEFFTPPPALPPQ